MKMQLDTEFYGRARRRARSNNQDENQQLEWNYFGKIFRNNEAAIIGK